MKGREYKIEEERKRKGGRDARLVTKFGEQYLRFNLLGQNPRTFFSSKLRLYFFLYQSSPTGDHLIRKSPSFLPSLYKFIGWAFLGLNPYLYKW